MASKFLSRSYAEDQTLHSQKSLTFLTKPPKARTSEVKTVLPKPRSKNHQLQTLCTQENQKNKKKSKDFYSSALTALITFTKFLEYPHENRASHYQAQTELHRSNKIETLAQIVGVQKQRREIKTLIRHLCFEKMFKKKEKRRKIPSSESPKKKKIPKI